MTTGHSRKIRFRSGGHLSVYLEDVSWMQFDADERALMSAMMDAIHAYEQRRRDASSDGTQLVEEIAVDPGGEARPDGLRAEDSSLPDSGAGRSPQGAPQDHPVAVAGRLEITLATFELRCLNEIAHMQTLISPDNALITLLCDAVRVKRELVALYESGAPPAPGWQPIETAPKNGLLVLLSGENRVVLSGFFDDGRWMQDGTGHTIYGSTHWMRWPAPPGAEAPAAARAEQKEKDLARGPDHGCAPKPGTTA